MITATRRWHGEDSVLNVRGGGCLVRRHSHKCLWRPPWTQPALPRLPYSTLPFPLPLLTIFGISARNGPPVLASSTEVSSGELVKPGVLRKRPVSSRGDLPTLLGLEFAVPRVLVRDSNSNCPDATVPQFTPLSRHMSAAVDLSRRAIGELWQQGV
jgi:hypothetical protein